MAAASVVHRPPGIPGMQREGGYLSDFALNIAVWRSHRSATCGARFHAVLGLL